MLTLPEILDRPEQAYAYVAFTVCMDQLKTPADQGFPMLFAHLAETGIRPINAPFYNYRRINMAETLDIEVGVPVDRIGSDSTDVKFATIPPGRYASLAWHGDFDGLEQATAMLIGWVRLVGHEFDAEERTDGEHFACRLEIYETDPSKVPDPKDWVTKLAFKLKE